MRIISYLLVSVLLISSLLFSSCDSGGSGSKDTTLQGTIEDIILIAQGKTLNYTPETKQISRVGNLTKKLLNFVTDAYAQVPNVKVSIEQGGKTLDKDNTDESGNFILKFNPDSDSGNATIRFEGEGFDLARVITVTRNSLITLDVTIDLVIPSVIFNIWQVDQDKIRVSGNDNFIFEELEADFTVNGNNNDCIKTIDNSTLILRVKSFTSIACKGGVESRDSSGITIEADEAISIVGKNDALRSGENSNIRIGQTTTAINNTVNITSNSKIGIKSTGNSDVVIDPQGTCVISGNKAAIQENDNSSINPGSCTLVGG